MDALGRTDYDFLVGDDLPSLMDDVHGGGSPRLSLCSSDAEPSGGLLLFQVLI